MQRNVTIALIVTLAAAGVFIFSMISVEYRSTLRVVSIFFAVIGFFLLITRNMGQNNDGITEDDEPNEEDQEDFETGEFDDED